jgi:hypothetical protein
VHVKSRGKKNYFLGKTRAGNVSWTKKYSMLLDN